MNISIVSVQNLQKILTTIAVFAMVFSPFADVQFATAANVFTNSFEGGAANNASLVTSNGWTSADNDWTITSGSGHTGSRKAQVSDQGLNADVLRKAISTVGQDTVVLSYYYRTGQAIEATEHVYVEWTANGSTWTQLADYTNINNGSWTVATHNLPAGANNNASFAFRFRATGMEPASGNGDHDEFWLDSVSFSTEVIPVDVCTNIDGAQATVPQGYIASNGICTQIPPPDVCPNIDGAQAIVPDGMQIVDGLCVPIPPPDVCPNIAGAQATVPEGKQLVDGQCVDIPPPPVDACPNIEGNQPTIPEGYQLNDGLCVPIPPPDVCPNIAGAQATVPEGYVLNDGLCVPIPPPVDVCTNIDGAQATLPEGHYFASAGICLPNPVDVCPNIEQVQTTIPEGMQIVDGQCVDIPPPDVCPNIAGAQATVPEGKQLVDGQCVDIPPQLCSVTLTSDTTNTVTEKAGAFAQALTFIHSGWTAVIADATWIWGDNPVVDPVNATTQTFVKSFYWNGPVTSTALNIAADNSYDVKVNNVSVGSSTTETNHTLATQDAYSAFNGQIVQGMNTVSVTVNNFAQVGGTAQSNPAGLLYKLVVTGTENDCGVEPMYTVDGYKWNDTDADGIWDEGENGISGWTILLTNSGTDVVTETTTGKGGYYSFIVPAGSYQVTEAGQSGWEQTGTVGNGADGDTCYYSFSNDAEAVNPVDASCDFGNHQNSVAQCLVPEQNLLSNGSFETPTVLAHSGEWEIFPSVTGWGISSDGLELWKGLFGAASNGLQNAELDGNTSTDIDQSVPTVVGNKYKVSFDFAARPNTNTLNNRLEVLADGVSLGTVSLDGTGDTQKDWVTYSYEFTATDGFTNVKFSDVGTDDSYGTLLDNTAVCLTEDNAEPVLGSLTIDKVVAGEGASTEQGFTFDTWLEGNTVISGAGTPVIFSNLVAGQYAFSEINLPAQWSVESVVCTDGEGPETDLDEILAGATVNVSNGENVTCVVTNRYTPRDTGGDDENIIVKKEVTENSDVTETFAFDASWFDEEGSADFYLTAGTEFNSGDLLAGDVYSVNELIEKGSDWEQASAVCTSSNEEREGTISPEEFVLNNSETITCVFTNDQERYVLEGYVWEDIDEDGVFDEGESPLVNWGVNATDGEETKETNSDVNGYYKFNVPAGTWTITEDLQSGWSATHPNPTQYVVTVPSVMEFTFIDSVVNFILPTAHAAVIETIDGLVFGNKQEPSRGGSSSGSRRKKTPDAPVPQVLGEATSTMPVGAPNTGAGGSSHDATLPSLVLALTATRTGLRKAK
jgi:hypothetical protein